MFWISYILLLLGFTIYLILHVWNVYVENATFVTRVSGNLPIAEIEFPGVAICNINKISKKKAIEFAKEL